MPLLPPRIPVKLKPSSDFNAEDFRRVVVQKGRGADGLGNVVWEQRTQCPCGRKLVDVAADMDYASPLAANFITGEPQTACPRCNNLGFFLREPQNIPVIIQNMAQYGRRFQSAGEYQQGMARITMLPEHKPSFGDRLTMRFSVQVVREDKRRTVSTTESLRFPIASQQQDLAAGLTTVKTLWLQKANADNNTNTTSDHLVEGTDYDVTPDGKIDWTKGIANGHAPALGATYTVSYYAAPRYVIKDEGHNVRESYDSSHRSANSPKFLALPIMVSGMLEYLGANGV